MKILITAIGTLLISLPLMSQTTNFSIGSGNQPGTDMAPASGQTPNTTAPITSPVTGAPVLDPSNTAPIPPSNLESSSPVNATGAETTGAGAGSTTLGTGTGTGVGVGTGAAGTGPTSTVPETTVPALPSSTSPVAPGMGTQQPSSIMNPTGTGPGWQGK